MIQSIYTSVSNADIVPCGKKGQKVSSEPIPLLRNNYLGEYRTELEKAKVRKNLGIADEQSLLWGNIEGHIEEQKDIIDYIKTMQEYTTDLNSSVTNVKEALDYVLEFVTNFKGEEEAIKDILENISTIHSHLTDLQNNLTTNSTNIEDLQSKYYQVESDIISINDHIDKLNQKLINYINNSDTLVLGDSLEVKISETEKNALSNDNGLFVQDLSEEVANASQNIENLQTKVNEIDESLENFVTKEDLGGNDFNFVNQDSFDSYKNITDKAIGDINLELDKTVKTGEDGHVDTLYVNKLSNQEGNIKIDKSFEVQSGVPLDIRTVVGTTEDLYKIDPKVAYKGMAVANASNGYIYMLMDPTRITEKSGWKASYESIQIITCTQEEYETMAANTNDDYTYKEEGKPFLYEDTYYYIYEDSIKNLEEQAYVKYSQFAQWQETLNNKASREALQSLDTTVTNLSTSLINNYSTTEQIASNYASILYVDGLLNLENPKSFISSLISNYYDKDYIDNNFVTLEYLKGEGSEETGYIFVSQKQYNEDQNLLKKELQTALKTEEDGSIKNLTVQTITSSQDNLAIQTKELYIGTEKVALNSDVPIIEVLSKTDYDKKLENGEILDNVYYYTYSDETTDGVVTNSILEQGYYKKGEVAQLIYTLEQRIITLEETVKNLQAANL